MGDPKRLRIEKQRIAEATRKSFDAYDRARRKALELASKKYLD